MSIIIGQPLKELPLGVNCTMLVYGDSGVGKTWFAGTAGDRNLYLSLGDGHLTIQSPGFQKAHPCNPHIIIFNEQATARGIVENANAFDNVSDTLEDWFTKRLLDFDTVTVDDMTSLGQFAAFKAMELSGRLRGSKSLSTAKSGNHIPIKEMGDWGIEIDAMRYFLSKLVSMCKQFNKNLICLAHERRYYNKPKKDQGGGEPTLKLVAPLFAGKDSFAPNIVPAMFDFVWHFTAVASGNTFETHARTQPNAVYIGKTRFAGVFKNDELNPNFREILSRIKGSVQA